MKFSDIDFSAIGKMLDSMSDEEKEQINQYANNMMENMQQNIEPEPVEEEPDFFEQLHIKEEDYQDLPGLVLDQIEAACDLEYYYEDDDQADFSASVLFYAKAVLHLLRHYDFAIYKELLNPDGFANPNVTTLYSYLFPLTDEKNIHTLVDHGYGDTSGWLEIQMMIRQLYTLLNRAEYDTVSYDDLQALKSILFEQKGLLKIVECTETTED